MASRRAVRRRLEQTCARKRGYETHEAAGYAMHKLRARVGAHHELRVYRCAGCGAWHVGHVQRRHTRRNYRGGEGLL